MPESNRADMSQGRCPQITSSGWAKWRNRRPERAQDQPSTYLFRFALGRG